MTASMTCSRAGREEGVYSRRFCNSIRGRPLALFFLSPRSFSVWQFTIKETKYVEGNRILPFIIFLKNSSERTKLKNKRPFWLVCLFVSQSGESSLVTFYFLLLTRVAVRFRKPIFIPTPNYALDSSL